MRVRQIQATCKDKAAGRLKAEDRIHALLPSLPSEHHRRQPQADIPRTVGTPDYKIAAMTGKRHALTAKHTIVKTDLLVRHHYPHRMRLRHGSAPRLPVSKPFGATRPGVDDPSVSLMRRLSGHDVGAAAAKAWIRHSKPFKPPEYLAIYLSATALAVCNLLRHDRPSPFVPVKSEPPQIILYMQRIFRFGTLRVKILYTKNPSTPQTGADNHDRRAVKTFPRCMRPEGEGANLAAPAEKSASITFIAQKYANSLTYGWISPE